MKIPSPKKIVPKLFDSTPNMTCHGGKAAQDKKAYREFCAYPVYCDEAGPWNRDFPGVLRIALVK